MHFWFCRLHPFLFCCVSVFLNASYIHSKCPTSYIWKKHKNQTEVFVFCFLNWCWFRNTLPLVICSFVLQGNSPSGWGGIWFCGYSPASSAHLYYLHISSWFRPTQFLCWILLCINVVHLSSLSLTTSDHLHNTFVTVT